MTVRDALLGIDVGTTAVKVAAFTVDGRSITAHTTGYPIHRPRPGWAQQDPLDWWQGCVRGLRAVLADLPAGSVRSIGLVSQVNTHLLVDARLRPLTPAIIWQDQRCADLARELDARFTAEEKTRIWGAPVVLDASFVGARAAWFAKEEPDAWARARWILSPKDFIGAKLTGRVATDLSSGVRVAGADGYLPAAVGLVDGLADRLPEILPAEASLGPATDFHLGPAEVVVGAMDAFGAVFGTRTTQPGRGMVCCGTSLVVAGASRESLPARGVVTFPPRRGVFVHAGPTQAAGDAVRWWSQATGLSIDEVFASASTGSPGVLFTPYLLGERAPLWDSAVRAGFLGLSSATSRADLSHAVLTGVAMSARQVLDVVEQACGAPLPSLTFSGGGARSDLWAQLHADITRRPVERLRVRDSAVLGAALLGAVGAGSYPDIDTAAAEAVATERVFLPAKDADRFVPLYEAYRAAYPGLREVHAILASWRAARS
ncbi:MAG TPA: FGGY-family carbohydrate kinase [Pseudonocardiaceae bacterium]|jgi:xylulokinase|nr:FGGY-family carbohydrate kinase [Pseudonocardiaceae bacterium]